MSEYTNKMFRADYDFVVPLVMKYRNLEALEKKEEVKPENAFLDISSLFLEKYGNHRGQDYQMRFLSTMQFIEHYTKDLLKDGVLTENNETGLRLPDSLLDLMLDSFKSPQPPSIYPSSTLHNSSHEFNYKKVLKAFKNLK